MSAKPVKVFIDTELLRRVDADSETLEKGRSAFVRSAIELYLKAKRRHEIERQIADAYDGEAEAMLGEVSELMDGQAWPKK